MTGTIWEEIAVRYRVISGVISGVVAVQVFFYCGNGDAIGTSVSVCYIVDVRSSGVVVKRGSAVVMCKKLSQVHNQSSPREQRELIVYSHENGVFLSACLLPCSVDLNAADTGVQLKTTIVSHDQKQTPQQKQDGCSC